MAVPPNMNYMPGDPYSDEPMKAQMMPVAFAMTAAILFGAGTPFAKILVGDVEPIMLAGLLYLGAFIGLCVYALFARITKGTRGSGAPLVREDIPWLAGSTLSGGIVAPICLMTGLTLTTGFTASLLLNLEGLATAVIAYLVFKENLGWRLGAAVVCMTVAGILLSWDSSTGAITVSGPLLLLAAGVSWGVDNNLTRKISHKDSVRISQIKGLVAGGTSVALALLLGFALPANLDLVLALLLGSVSYGASLVFFIQALQGMGASRTGAFFSLGPFVGAAVSVALLRESLSLAVIPAALLMLAGVLAIVYERHSHAHAHDEITHTHLHAHDDQMHGHPHDGPAEGQHVHEHTHPSVTHDHIHWPDIHHRHEH